MARFKMAFCLCPLFARLSWTFTNVFWLISLVLFHSLAPQPLVAADKGPTRDPQALALLAQCGTAMGGALIQDMSATGTLTTADPKAPPVSIITQSKGAAERFDISLPDDPQTFVLNGGNSWSIQQGKQTELPYALIAYRRPEHTPALACILDIQNQNMSFAYVGQEKFQGGVVEHVRISLPTTGDDNTDSVISQLDVFLDTQTLVVLKTECFVFDPEAYQNHSVWTTQYSDYRAIGTVLMPFHIENYLDGHKVRDVGFSSVQVNVGVPDSQFQKPNQQSK
jgi:hypothetical protein